jgi:hypothetical protein
MGRENGCVCAERKELEAKIAMAMRRRGSDSEGFIVIPAA